MEKIMPFLSELVVMSFKLILYMKLIVFKKNTILYRSLMHTAVGLILAAYLFAYYIYNIPAYAASLCFVKLPSYLIFWLLSAYKDARFLVTVCLADTVSLIIASFACAAGNLAEGAEGIMTFILLIILFPVIYIFVRPYFSKYRQLFEYLHSGWRSLLFLICFIYLLLTFAAAYPEPLADRTECFVLYALLSVTCLSLYALFLMLLLQKKKFYDMNIQLKEEQRWHNIAYVDILTGLKNRAAYMEYTNSMERELDARNVFIIMIDLDEFKRINDTFGHYVGDQTLKKIAEYLLAVFDRKEFEIFRIGGDEFVIVAVGIGQEELNNKMTELRSVVDASSLNCSFSFGIADVKTMQNNAMEDAWIRADRAMYKEKKEKKNGSV